MLPVNGVTTTAPTVPMIPVAHAIFDAAVCVGDEYESMIEHLGFNSR